MSTLEASRMHNLSFSSRVASCSEKRLLRACRAKKSASGYSSNGPHRASAVMTLSEKEAQPQASKKEGRQPQAAKQPASLKSTELTQVLPKKVWKLPSSRKSEQDPQVTWTKMMKDIREVGSPVTVLHAYHKAGKLSKETMVGTLMQFKKLKEWKYLTEIIGWLKHQSWWTFSELDYNLQLVAYAKIGEPEKVKKTINSMKKAGFQPNVASHTSLIEAYGKKGLLYEAEGILNKMLEEGPKPTALTYQTMIGAFVKGEKYADADRIYKSLETDNIVKPDQKLCNLMIHSYGKRGMIEEAFHLSRKMKALNIPLSVVTFNSLLSCQPSVQDTESVFRQMQRSNIEPDVISYASRLSAFAKARRGEEAQYFFKTMVASGIRPNRTVYNVLMDAYANCKMIDEAEALLKEMRRDRCSPDVHSYTTLMNAYVNMSNMEKAEKVLERMRIMGIEPNIVTYGTLIKGYAEKGDLDAMVTMYKELTSREIKVNQPIFTTMLQAFGRHDSLDRAKDWFQEMVSAGFEPDGRAQNALLALSDTLHRREEILDFIDNLP
eukprot:c9692_g1_i1 orf=69-1715(+)